MSNFFHSAETRWFFPMALPEEVKTWFLSNQFIKAKEQFDDYLIIPDCETVGIKLRDGLKLEIKAQTMVPRVWRLGQIGGKIDHWVKQSFETNSLPDLKKNLFEDGHWLKVKKTRLIKKFSMESGTLMEIPLEQWPTAGCNYELTDIYVLAEQDTWFSIALEAFGSPGNIDFILNEAINSFFKPHNMIPVVKLTNFNAMSYPAWLISI